MRRVEVTQRFQGTVFIRSTPIPKEEQLSDEDAEAGRLPKEPLTPGEHVLMSGAVELKATVLNLESQREPKDSVADEHPAANRHPVAEKDRSR
jgi:cobalt-zinc-cadmium efflux system membrane fusion protein